MSNCIVSEEGHAFARQELGEDAAQLQLSSHWQKRVMLDR